MCCWHTKYILQLLGYHTSFLSVSYIFFLGELNSGGRNIFPPVSLSKYVEIYENVDTSTSAPVSNPPSQFSRNLAGARDLGVVWISIWRPELVHFENIDLNRGNYTADMAEYNVDIGSLPVDVRAKLAELDLELSEGRLLRPHPLFTASPVFAKTSGLAETESGSVSHDPFIQSIYL